MAPGRAVAVKFLRQFGAVVVLVVVVVLIGLAWNRLDPRLPGEGPGGRSFVAQGRVVKGLPPGVALPPAGQLPIPGLHQNDGSGIPGLLPGDLLKPANLVVLRNNAQLEAVVIAAVVLADIGYRKLRRARRAAARRPLA